ncbi:MAG: type II toxin-antitoxin system HicB family antitoxin [Pseudonocardia sp.]|nr:type II toxin-antitoxin system HicB family antitoxin [Pseudonocardia sp.]
MRQLITRIDDDLHTRLKELAGAEGTSMNALVVRALERVTGAAVDARTVVHRRARDAGMLVVPPRPDRVPSRDEVIASTGGAGAAVSEALSAERDTS